MFPAVIISRNVQNLRCHPCGHSLITLALRWMCDFGHTIYPRFSAISSRGSRSSEAAFLNLYLEHVSTEYILIYIC